MYKRQPLGTLSYLKVAAENGLLVKKGQALESLITVDTVLFDKTGTLTDSTLTVTTVLLCMDYTEDQLLRYAAIAEMRMQHPIAQAIRQKAADRNVSLVEVNDASYQVGYGISVMLNGESIQVGSVRFMAKEGIALPDKIQQAMEEVHRKGHSMVLVAVNGLMIGAIELVSTVRAEVESLMINLREQGIKHIAIVSGDHEKPTQNLAEQLQMDNYFYDVLPEDKATIVETLQAQGRTVCFVGDGINDAIAMQTADVSISLMGASSIATNAADIVLIEETLLPIKKVFNIAHKLDKNLRTSFMISLLPTAINLLGIYFYHLGYMTAIVIKNLAFFIGIGNAVIPAKKRLTRLT